MPEVSPRRVRREDREIRRIAARTMDLSYGPSECRAADADELLVVGHVENAVTGAKRVPVQWVMTDNRGILETKA